MALAMLERPGKPKSSMDGMFSVNVMDIEPGTQIRVVLPCNHGYLITKPRTDKSRLFFRPSGSAVGADGRNDQTALHGCALCQPRNFQEAVPAAVAAPPAPAPVALRDLSPATFPSRAGALAALTKIVDSTPACRPVHAPRASWI